MNSTHLNSMTSMIICCREAFFLQVHREKAGVIFSLYSLHNFYVEVGFNVKDNESTGISTFKSLIPLDDYLGDIELTI